MDVARVNYPKSRSMNARIAESNGRLPLKQAVSIVAERMGCSRRRARSALKAIYDGEWHHTGSSAKRTRYYDVKAAIEHLKSF